MSHIRVNTIVHNCHTQHTTVVMIFILNLHTNITALRISTGQKEREIKKSRLITASVYRSQRNRKSVTSLQFNITRCTFVCGCKRQSLQHAKTVIKSKEKPSAKHITHRTSTRGSPTRQAPGVHGYGSWVVYGQ